MMTLQTFLHEGHIFTSPTRSEFPAQGVPPIDDSPPAIPTPSDPWERCGWGKNWYPELACYPTSSIPTGTLFRTLRFYPKSEIPLDKRTLRHITVYRFASADEWSRLEKLLFRIRRILEPHANILVGTDAVAIPDPSSESYTAWGSNPTAVRNRIFYARKKFLYMVCTISFLIAILSLRHGGEHVWYTLLLENGLDAHLADEISSSCVSDFSRNNPRAGLFLDPSLCPWPEWLPALIHADVPVFIDWGPVESLKPPTTPHLKRLYPNAAQLEHVLAHPPPLPGAVAAATLLSAPWRLKEGVDWLTGSLRSYSPSTEQPPKRKYTWKGLPVLEGEVTPAPPRFEEKETPGKFFTRRATYRQHFIDHVESSHQRNIRLEREKDARCHSISEIGHDELFEWDFYVETMSWRRYSVPREDRLAVWNTYDRSSKRYDSVADEWDLAPFLGTKRIHTPASTHQSNQDLSDDGRSDDLASFQEQGLEPQDPFFCDGDFRLAPPPPDTTLNADPQLENEPGITFDALPDTSPHSSPTTIPAELEDGEIPSEPTVYIDERQEVPNVIDLIDVAKTRHGLTWAPVLAPACVQTLTVAEACRAFGYYIPFHGTNVLLEDALQAHSFVTWVANMSRSDLPPLPLLTSWLLHPHKHKVLGNELQSSDIAVFRMRDDRTDDQTAKVWGLVNKMSRPSNRAPVVAVRDPSTVLAVVRSFKRLDDDVIRWLVGSGITFSYMFRARADPTPSATSSDMPMNRARLPMLRLISRPISHVFTADDYHSYEEARNHLLRSSRRIMRAALLSGGILWRLAIDAVSPDVVLEEPDYNACARGIGLQYFRDADRDPYLDDALTRDEIRILVGMYVVSHRDRENPDNSAYPMWWPEPLRFNASSLDYGWWTPVDEHWYRKTREKYRHGQGQPKVGVAWRSSLRNYNKRSRIFMSHSRDAAGLFLDSFLNTF